MPAGHEQQRAVGRNGFAIVVIPSLLLALPLAFHRSPEPVIGPYGARYAGLLAAVGFTVLAIATLAAWRSRRAGSTRPAMRILFVMFGLCLTFVALECASRYLFGDAFATYRKWGQQKSSICVFETQPKHSWTAHGGNYTTDRNGFRNNIATPDWQERWPGLRAAGGKLVAVIGGSSVFGYGLHDDATWPHLLQAKLSNAATTVVNAGNNGHGSLQLRSRLDLRVLPLRPTHVIYYGGVNDVYDKGTELDKIAEHEAILFAPSQAAYLAKVYADSNYYARTVLAHIARKRFPDLLGSAETDGRSGDPSQAELSPAQRRIIAENARRFGRNLAAMADLCRRDGVRLILTTFLFDGAPMPPFARAGLVSHNEVLRRVAAREELPLVDLARSFVDVADKAGHFFGDHYHPNWAGARFIAEGIAAELPRLLER